MKWIILIALVAGAWFAYDSGVFQTIGSKATGTYNSSVEQNKQMMP